MNATKLHRVVPAALGLVASVFLAGCANSPRWGEWSKHPTNAQIAAVLARTTGSIAMQPTPAVRPATLLAATNP